MSKNNIIITIVSVVVMLGFLYGAYALTSQPEVAEYTELQEIKPADHIKWSDKKERILVEYSDLQCPACQQYHSLLLSELNKDPEVTENVTFVYRHFPLDAAHPNARDAAYAAEAAAKQGKFYEMHDLLFEKQGEWSPLPDPKETFIGYAESLKLDPDQFTKDMDSKDVQDKVQNDFLSGNDYNVQGTPTFFLNGKKLNNPASVEEFKQVLLEESST